MTFDPTPFDTVFRASRVVTGTGESSLAIGVRDGRIAAVEGHGSAIAGQAARIVDLAADEVLLPGLVDTHVHVNEPGRTEWEGFATATRAAAAGGVTTIVDMPLNTIPPTIDAAALAVKQKSADGQVWVDTGFWGGAVPDNIGDLRPLHEAGVFGFKCFLLHAGVDEFPHLDAPRLERVLQEIRRFDGLLIVHAEDATAIDRAPRARGPRYADYLRSRPRGAENVAIAQLIELARWAGARVHVLHLSSSDVLPMIASARRDGVRITVETCPHYLTFAAEEIADGATEFKCCPPIREAENRELLWQGLADGTIDCVVSDHSPCTTDLKRLDIGDFGAAWGGISSLELGLSATWTAARERGFSLSDCVRWTAANPADLAGLDRKGRIAVGHDADFCVFAPDDTVVVTAGDLVQRHPVTPYLGATLTGTVRSSWLRGERVADAPRGRLLVR